MTRANYETDQDRTYEPVSIFYDDVPEERVAALGEGRGVSMLDMVPAGSISLTDAEREQFQKALETIEDDERANLIESFHYEKETRARAAAYDRQELEEFVEDTDLRVGDPIDESRLEPGRVITEPSYGGVNVPEAGEEDQDPFTPDGF